MRKVVLAAVVLSLGACGGMRPSSPGGGVTPSSSGDPSASGGGTSSGSPGSPGGGSGGSDGGAGSGGATGGSGGMSGGSGGAGGTDGGGGSGGMLDADQFCAAFYELMASRAAECLGGNVDQRRSDIDASTRCALMDSSIAQGRITFDAAQAASCLDRLAHVACFDVQPTIDDPASACKAALAGSADGSACRRDDECLATSYCAHAGSCDGVCKPRPTVGSTTDCILSDCNYPNECVCTGRACTSHVCRAPLGPGGVVVMDSQDFCDRGLTCVDSTPKSCSAYWCQQCTCTREPNACGGNPDCASGQMCTDEGSCVAAQTDWCLAVPGFDRGACPTASPLCP